MSHRESFYIQNNILNTQNLQFEPLIFTLCFSAYS